MILPGPPVAKDVVILVLVVVEVATAGLWLRASRRAAAREREVASLEEELGSVPVRAQHAAGWALRQVVDTATRVRERGFVGGLVMAPIEELTRWASEDRAEIARVAADDGTVTVLFSDIEGSTRLNEELGDEEWVQVLGAHDRVVRQQVDRHSGHVVKSQGDGFMVVFSTPPQAVAAAVGIQKGMRSAGRRLRRTPVQVRIGIHTGTAVARDGDYFGRNVAKAARVAAVAEGGQVLVSEEAANGLDVDRLVDAGTWELKGLSGDHLLYRVPWEGR